MDVLAPSCVHAKHYAKMNLSRIESRPGLTSCVSASLMRLLFSPYTSPVAQVVLTARASLTKLDAHHLHSGTSASQPARLCRLFPLHLDGGLSSDEGANPCLRWG
ncbi:unnamed protein product [Protopolystoma xenopodis]|uniref:Uncharacterized protein n=1 Tax=Protopolystoma xenopodis TaxID=117903 RepID=A0A448WBV9_9PLAT|nr:unnamed protein product [Protopolystoma xenopodis]